MNTSQLDRDETKRSNRKQPEKFDMAQAVLTSLKRSAEEFVQAACSGRTVAPNHPRYQKNQKG